MGCLEMSRALKVRFCSANRDEVEWDEHIMAGCGVLIILCGIP